MKRILYLIVMLFVVTACSKSNELEPKTQLVFTKGMIKDDIVDLSKKILIKEKITPSFEVTEGAIGKNNTPVVVLKFKNGGLFGFVMEYQGLVAYSHYYDLDEEVEVLYNHLSPEVRDNNKYREK
ncbi:MULTISPECIES: membrane lipoprotein lipid attachment site-containing protein [Sphingobacterium]|uniref:membrane lipoprotein lipid attachment site-containing protein n=1 Tax=Sphingobacterium TaxID=28453 RepID=UPI0013DB7222|nr:MULTISPECIES: membrane lipoprotein lipid attachment site-containing protein [unclassified Sphingobacterium]